MPPDHLVPSQPPHAALSYACGSGEPRFAPQPVPSQPRETRGRPHLSLRAHELAAATASRRANFPNPRR